MLLDLRQRPKGDRTSYCCSISRGLSTGVSTKRTIGMNGATRS
ncbi:MAG: hypothetical protein AB1589_13265 [Cyanobacteriota bacterium]